MDGSFKVFSLMVLGQLDFVKIYLTINKEVSCLHIWVITKNSRVEHKNIWKKLSKLTVTFSANQFELKDEPPNKSIVTSKNNYFFLC